MFLLTSSAPAYIRTPFTPKKNIGCRRRSLPPHHFSVGVQRGGEDDVPADGQRGFLHLAPEDGVSHDAGGLSHLLQHLVQTLNAADHGAFLDVCELGDLCERLRGGCRKRERGRGGGSEPEIVSMYDKQSLDDITPNERCWS